MDGLVAVAVAVVVDGALRRMPLRLELLETLETLLLLDLLRINVGLVVEAGLSSSGIGGLERRVVIGTSKRLLRLTRR